MVLATLADTAVEYPETDSPDPATVPVATDKMSEATSHRVLLLCRDEPTLTLLSGWLGARGAVVSCAAALGAVAGGRWSLVCVDEVLGIAVDELDVGDAPLLWLSREPRGDATARALAAGAADVLALPLWEPEARARLARWLPDTRPQEETTQDALRWLLEAQQELIPTQVPREIVARMRAGLQRLFPGAEVEIDLASSASARGAPEAPPPEPGPTATWSTAHVALESGGVQQGEVRVRAPHGESYPAAQRCLLGAYAAQAAQGLHRTRLYETLSRGKADWEQTFDAIPDSIAVITPDYLLRRINRARASSCGCSPQELIGIACYRAFHNRTAPCDPCPLRAVFQRGVSVRWPQEVRRNERVYVYQAFPLCDPEGRVRAAITYGRDVTRQEQLEQGLRHSEKLMTLGQLAAGIAHEINNPLTAISSYAQLLELRTENPKGAESARRIQHGIERIHRLVQNLMSFARPADDTFYPLDINDIVVKTLSFSRYEVTRGDTRLEQQLQPGLPKVLGSEAQLEQLFVNLLTNARDAVGGRGTVRVATRTDGDRVRLSVSDDGIGFDPEQTDRLFEPFFTTKPVGKGTGLGLFIAAGIAEKHRGSLRLSSRPGLGTEACLTLPVFL